ncbi:unnamed protein product [Bemisia tabaci]|uniref:Osiris 21 n=1 Tax=Bemisia tabaci TaxID=7038 RepID=A0A9P0CBU5_BEMTA|nr:unnamed protein product [Bemisia tabaci]
MRRRTPGSHCTPTVFTVGFRMTFVKSIRITFLGSICLIVIASETTAQFYDNQKFITGLKLALNVYRQCEKQDIMICLKSRALKLIERASNSKSISIYDGITLIKSADTDGRSFSKKHLSGVEGEKTDEKTLDEMLKHNFDSFMQTHSIQLRVPKAISDGIQEVKDYLLINDNTVEGRDKKKKKMGQFVMWAMMVKGGMIAMFFKGLAIVSGTALVASKVALTLASIIAIKALFSSGHSAHEKTTYEIVKTPIVTNSHQYSASSHVGDWGPAEVEGSGPYARTLELPVKPNYPYQYHQHQDNAHKTDMKPSPVDHSHYGNY